MPDASAWIGQVPLWRHLVETITGAAEEHESTLFLIDGPPGTGRGVLFDLIETALSDRSIEVRSAEPLGGDRMRSGRMADLLGLIERPPSDSVVLVIREAQWADATSVGVIRTLLADRDRVVAVLGFAQPRADVAIVLDRLAESTGRHGTVHRIELTPMDPASMTEVAEPDVAEALVQATAGDPAEMVRLLEMWAASGSVNLRGDRITASGRLSDDRPILSEEIAGLAAPQRRLVEAASLAGLPLPIGIAALLLEAGEDEALSVGEELAGRGLLRDTAAGFAPGDPERAERIGSGVGAARRAALYGRLADAFLAGREREAARPEVARFLLEAGRPTEALPLLAVSAFESVASGGLSEALPLLDDALEAYAAGGADPQLEGRLHLARAQVYRYLGWSARASDDAEIATRRLSGSELVDAYGWAAAVADDRQRVQEAERLLAVGEYVAATNGELAKLGSLLTLRARVLGRLGFGNEADAAADRGEALVARHGNEGQRKTALYNRAWIDFDQGRMRMAEVRFADLVARYRDEGASSQLADTLAWQARTLMYGGRPDQAVGLAAEAIEIADRGGEVGPIFLAAIARAHGAALYGAADEALAAADELLAIVLHQLPQWENAARFHRAGALRALGHLDEAAEEADRAILACPDGASGDPWRLRCRVSALRISAARGEPWPARIADDLTEELLNRRWNLPAAILLSERALREKDPELARRGAALAMQLGVPMVAALNAHTGNLWTEAAGVAVSGEIRRLATHVPAAWEEAWRALPEVAAALEVPEAPPADVEAAIVSLREDLERVFEEAGLAGADHVLSPAQRRAAGLRIRRPRRRSRWRVLAMAGGALIVAGVAVVALVISLRPPTPEAQAPATVTVTVPQVIQTVTVATPVTTTTLPPVWERQLPEPESEIIAQWGYRGARPTAGADRPLTGTADVSGVLSPGGFYFRTNTNDPIAATAVVRGRNIFVGNLSGSFFVLETDGDLVRTLSPETGRRILLPATAELIGGTAGSEASRLDVVFFGDTEGRLHAADAGSGLLLPGWDASTGGPISTAPLVVEDLVLVGSGDGYVHAFSLAQNGVVAWRFPGEDSEIAPSSPIGGMAYVGGLVYVAREDGSLYAIDPATGVLAVEGERSVCAVEAGGLQGTPAGNPVVVDGYVYVAAGPFVWRFEALDCRVPTTLAFIQGSDASAPPAIDTAAQALYQPIGRFVLRYDLAGQLPLQSHSCQYPLEGGRVDIESAPSVARREDGTSIVYFGDNAGMLHAIDGETCELLWDWPTGGAITSSPALGDRVVIVTSADGTITAIGPDPGGE